MINRSIFLNLIFFSFSIFSFVLADPVKSDQVNIVMTEEQLHSLLDKTKKMNSSDELLAIMVKDAVQKKGLDKDSRDLMDLRDLMKEVQELTNEYEQLIKKHNSLSKKHEELVKSHDSLSGSYSRLFYFTMIFFFFSSLSNYIISKNMLNLGEKLKEAPFGLGNKAGKFAEGVAEVLTPVAAPFYLLERLGIMKLEESR